jgi:hypothetical protein
MSRSSGELRTSELVVAAGLPPTHSVHTDHLIEAVESGSRLKNRYIYFFSNLEEAGKFGIISSNLQSLAL